mgnify:CR=1 FL=1
MADTRSPSPSPEDMHWGISYLREDLQDVRQDLRDFRKEVAQQLRHNLMVMVGVTVGMIGIFATLTIAFIQYKLPGG